MECDLGDLVEAGELYTITEILGRDEVRTVCEVLEYLSPTRRAVLHLMNPELVGSVQHRSFMERAAILEGIRHPNLLRVLRAGETPDAAPFYLTELERGVTLRKLLSWVSPRRVMPAWHARKITCDVLRGVNELSRHGLVHGDIRPETILVRAHRTKTDLVAAQIADFGAIYGRGISEPPGLPVAPAYASPERLRNEGDHAKTDVFSVGVVLFEMLTGCRPFEDDERDAWSTGPSPPKGHAECRVELELLADLLVATGCMKERDAHKMITEALGSC